MANRTISMEKIRQIKLLEAAGVKKKAIARCLGISRNTVKSYLQQGDEAPQDEQPARLQALLAFFPYCAIELSRPGVTRQILWGEYRMQHPDGYSYTQFCEHLSQWLETKQATLHIEQQPGDKMYVDFTGQHFPVADPATGEIRQVEIFVSTLGFSGLSYVRACESQKKEDFLTCIVHALNYYGAIPRVLVPDNLKSGVDKASRYEADINRDLLDLGNHYGMAILPARSYKPRDKAWVERMVQLVYNRIFAPLRNRVFTSLTELNMAIAELLEIHNRQLLTLRKQSRWELYLTQEKATMMPLPSNAYELKEYLQVKVMKNCHVKLSRDQHYYSVPYVYIGQKVKIVYTATTVSIYCRQQRIAYHLRDRKPYAYTTVKEHLPSTHQYVSDWHPEKFIHWAEGIHPDVKDYITRVLDNKSYPEQTYRSCAGILSLDRKAGRERLVAACQRAASYGVFNYKVIQQIINQKLDRTPEVAKSSTMPTHENIRGADYYR